MEGFSKLQHISNEDLRSRSGMKNVTENTYTNKNLVNQVARMNKKQCAGKVADDVMEGIHLSIPLRELEKLRIKTDGDVTRCINGEKNTN